MACIDYANSGKERKAQMDTQNLLKIWSKKNIKRAKKSSKILVSVGEMR